MKARNNNVVDWITSILLIPIGLFFILSSSIVVPILDRQFYFMQIGPLHIQDESVVPCTVAEIKEAFNNVLDYIWCGAPFKTGIFAYTEEGAAHFADCKVLFILDLVVFIVTSLLLIAILVLKLTKVVKIKRILGLSPIFYSTALLLVFVAVVGIMGAVDFDNLFILFHKVMFPGKDNYWFDYYTDQIVNILPEAYFMNCAILIAVIMFLECCGAMTYSIIDKVKTIKNNRDYRYFK